MAKKKSPPTPWEITKPLLKKVINAHRFHPNMSQREVVLL
jgi:hypothetical protein